MDTAVETPAHLVLRGLNWINLFLIGEVVPDCLSETLIGSVMLVGWLRGGHITWLPTQKKKKAALQFSYWSKSIVNY